MGPLEAIGFVLCLWALGFVAALGLTMGVWAGIKAATAAFGPLISVNVHKSVAVREEG